jgi:chromosome segregation protein
VAESAKLAEEARGTAELLAKDVAAVAEELAKAVAASGELGEQLLAAREAAGQIEKLWHTLEINKREAEIRRDNIEGRASEELGSAMGGLYREYCELLADNPPLIGADEVQGDDGESEGAGEASEGAEAGEEAAPVEAAAVTVIRVLPVEHEETAATIEELRREIKKLGNVNLDAIEEESQLAGRNEDLAAQVTDLDTASRQLVELIEKLKDASRERFRRTFETVQEHFAGDGGMFRKLFGGGKAEIRLMPVVRDGAETGETDWLESGIEIVARPPGKQPRSISQLSGGEKSMTAVALLMAIFRSKPSCFCVLDEVDAALDDANVDRFCRVVEEFTSMSSFIVITHHKRTMHQADQLFGVTMQERGVSKRVSVRIDQIGADGSIKDVPAEASGRAGKAAGKDPEKLAPIGTGNLREKPAPAAGGDDATGADLKRGLAAMQNGEAVRVGGGEAGETQAK